MHKNDLLQVLRTFSKQELKEFRKFLNSDYFGKRKKSAELLKLLNRYYPMYTHVHLERRTLFKNLYPGRTYNGSTLRNLFCDLHEAALHFMTIKNFEASGESRYNFLFNELMLKGLPGEFAKVINRIETEHEEGIDWLYFLNRHFIETGKFNFSHYNLKLKKKKNLGNEISNLNESINNLIYYFVTELISLYFNFIFYRDSFDTAQYTENINKAFSLIDFSKLRDILKNDNKIFVVDIYQALLGAFTNPLETAYYHKYKNELTKNFDKLSKDEICFHYYKLVTYCVIGGQQRFTGFDYDNELFTLYKDMLEKKYYLDRNTAHLPHELYRNILQYCIRIKDYEWLGEFIRKYSFMVFPADRLNMFHYGNAYMHYNMGNYTEALRSINNIDLNFFIYKVDIKNLSLMIYYDSGEIEPTLALINSYKEFIRKNSLLNPEKKKRYINFSKFLEKMTLYRAGTLKQDIGYISHRLSINNQTAFKGWLNEKIASQNRKRSA